MYSPRLFKRSGKTDKVVSLTSLSTSVISLFFELYEIERKNNFIYTFNLRRKYFQVSWKTHTAQIWVKGSNNHVEQNLCHNVLDSYEILTITVSLIRQLLWGMFKPEPALQMGSRSCCHLANEAAADSSQKPWSD